MKAAVIYTGVANVASVQAGLRRAGVEPVSTTDPHDVTGAQLVVLPGVGAFGAGMEVLRRAGLVEPLRERIAAGRPTLTVCLGLQLLAAASEESPGVEGLNVFANTVRRFTGPLRVPQLGWNYVQAAPECGVLQSGYAYFANSYRLETAPAGFNTAVADYGSPFIAAIERGGVIGCQFHPELSGAWGIDLIRRWVQTAREDRQC